MGGLSTGTLFRQRGFSVLFGAQTFAGLGDSVFRVVQIALLLRLDAPSWTVAALMFSAVLPGLVFSLLGGALADRLERRRILVVTNLLRGAAMLAMAGVTALGLLELWHLFALAVLYGSVSAFADPAFNALLPQIVGREHLQQGNALFALGDNLARIAGPALAGALLVLAGAPQAMLLTALAFLGLMLTLLSLRPPRRGVSTPPQPVLQEALAGLRYAAGHRTLLTFLGFFGVVNVCGAILVTTLPLFVTRSLGLDASAYGLLLSASGVGIVVGLGAMNVLRFRRRGLAIAGAALLAAAAGYLPLGLAPWLPFSLAVALLAVAVVDGLSMVANVLYPAWVQSEVPDGFRGRVFGVTTLVAYSLVPVGYGVAGVLSILTEPHTALLLAGALLALAGVGSLAVPAFRALR